ncbi:GFA family protein [Pelagibius sp. Alg239-R121]|uniref:GFA family protein n=1 Tax=Pelagibius sp. Alg239-R121 TaxID=2993448 RepID=UPI0024A6A6EE|nr:GFA family protein [Pelagibius sp. Alg239-R121]
MSEKVDAGYHLDGGCGCGAVRYRMLTAPMFVHCCHCLWCQRESGSAFALNAIIESDRVMLLKEKPIQVGAPSQSGEGQKFFRCPNCQIALWSHYAMAVGDKVLFLRSGTLDEPRRLSPDIHIFTGSKQPWLPLSTDIPAVEEYYDRKAYWPPESLERFHALRN